MKGAKNNDFISKLPEKSGKSKKPYVVQEGISGKEIIISYANSLEQANEILNNFFNELFTGKVLCARFSKEEFSELNILY